MAVLLTDLLQCTHPIELCNQCASIYSGTPTALQNCSRCGSFRWLRGANPEPWQRPSLVEQAVIQQLQERHKGTCSRCGAINPLKIEDCISGSEIPGAGTEPHVFG